MPKILKRADFWIFLAVVGGVGGYLALSGRTVAPGGGDARFAVGEISLRRDYGNFVATFVVDYDNRDGEAFDATAAARLLADGERPIPGYFLAGGERQIVPADGRAEIPLEFWLEAADLGGRMVLEIRGERLEVKSASPYDGGRIANQATAAITGIDWK